ncbi:hypothetical protein KQ51_01853 [Candidatus Izimaplasma bacterium HR1]|jgi:hypothetical protein|uniref:hypothetical protein n=1 Tax=Candidatus Izimoplasma sp. HR1 TaxID=1541959 RepID=UPI0004F67CC2|nr:hypothetical protein KQ51_01853 [Candidatus Izimaplasma bacterium HR1]
MNTKTNFFRRNLFIIYFISLGISIVLNTYISYYMTIQYTQGTILTTVVNLFYQVPIIVVVLYLYRSKMGVTKKTSILHLIITLFAIRTLFFIPQMLLDGGYFPSFHFNITYYYWLIIIWFTVLPLLSYKRGAFIELTRKANRVTNKVIISYIAFNAIISFAISIFYKLFIYQGFDNFQLFYHERFEIIVILLLLPVVFVNYSRNEHKVNHLLNSVYMILIYLGLYISDAIKMFNQPEFMYIGYQSSTFLDFVFSYKTSDVYFLFLLFGLYNLIVCKYKKDIE